MKLIYSHFILYLLIQNLCYNKIQLHFTNFSFWSWITSFVVTASIKWCWATCQFFSVAFQNFLERKSICKLGFLSLDQQLADICCQRPSALIDIEGWQIILFSILAETLYMFKEIQNIYLTIIAYIFLRYSW